MPVGLTAKRFRVAPVATYIRSARVAGDGVAAVELKRSLAWTAVAILNGDHLAGGEIV